MMNKTILSPKARNIQATKLVKSVRWNEYNIQTTKFLLKAYGSKPKARANILTVYIEGDGLAWISSDKASDNPTPINPMGLKMAIHDRKNYPIAYLARPCQYNSSENPSGCLIAYWTHSRFSPEVIQAMNQGITFLKKQYHAKYLILIGYSGGGTVATLISAERKDVKKLITVAAILDIKQWVDRKSLTPLYGSLNPRDQWQKLARIPQIHWVGDKDTVSPKEITFAFARLFPSEKKPKVIVKPNFDHICCWATAWQPE